MVFNNKISVTVNGKKTKIVTSQKVTIYHLITFLGYKPNYIALECNNSIIFKTEWKKIYLKNNTNIEVVTIVGGG
jgi:thiamine biosynthesis protein ThiS